MSHNQEIHSAQVSILRELLFLPQAGYAELQKPTGFTSDHFNFHISRLQELGLVEKLSKGIYRLSKTGKEYANKLDTDNNTVERQPKTSVALLIERTHNGKTEYLCQQRLKNPYYGYWGRLGGKIRWGETVEEAASRELLEETGLSAKFMFKLVFHKRDYQKNTKELLEDKLFFIMHTDKYTGTLTEKFEGGLNRWMTQQELASQEKHFESAYEFVTLADKGVSFIEKEYFYGDEDY